jgi:hypothetical protein
MTAPAFLIYTSDNPTTGFDNTAINTLPVGWSNVGGNWSVSNTFTGSVLQPIGHKFTLGINSTSRTNGVGVLYTGNGAYQNSEILYIQIYVNPFNSTWGAGAAAYVRANSNLYNWYAVGYNNFYNSNTAVNLSIWKSVSGTDTNLLNIGALTGINYGTPVAMRTRINGSTLQSRLWLAGSVEPNTWTFTLTDSGVTAAGYNGIEYNSGDNSGNISVTDVNITAVTNNNIQIFSPGNTASSSNTITINGIFSGFTPTGFNYSINGNTSLTPVSSFTVNTSANTFQVQIPTNSMPLAAWSSIYIEDSSATSGAAAIGLVYPPVLTSQVVGEVIFSNTGGVVVSQVSGEALLANAGFVNTSQVVAETLLANSGFINLSQVVGEVLFQTAPINKSPIVTFVIS